jgi:hypothetical protein
MIQNAIFLTFAHYCMNSPRTLRNPAPYDPETLEMFEICTLIISNFGPQGTLYPRNLKP